MNAALLAARVVLVGVLLGSGLAKLADLGASRGGTEALGIPPRLAGPLGTLLPFAELTVAVALLPAGSAGWGAVGALSLLSLFTCLVVANLAVGRRPDCHCFGQVHSAPISATTVARNVSLTALAAWIVLADRAGPRLSALAWVGRLSGGDGLAIGAGVAAAVALTALAWALR